MKMIYKMLPAVAGVLIAVMFAQVAIYLSALGYIVVSNDYMSLTVVLTAAIPSLMIVAAGCRYMYLDIKDCVAAFE